MIVQKDAREWIDGKLLQELERKTGKTSRQEADIDLTYIQDGQILGSLHAKYMFETCFLDLLAVEPACRKQGIGLQLMQTLEAECIKKGVKTILLTTQDYQAPGFYTKCGYTCHMEMEDVPFQGTVRYFFSKKL